VLALLAAAGGLAVLRRLEAETVVQQSIAAALGVVLALGLAVRSGGRALPAFLLAVLVGAGAVASQWPVLLSGAAVATGVLAACLAILGTRPAHSFWRAGVEVLLAEAVAIAGALGVAGFAADLDPERFGYTGCTGWEGVCTASAAVACSSSARPSRCSWSATPTPKP
jgi:hypothetical protein